MIEQPTPAPLSDDDLNVLRETGFYWVQLGQNPPEVACWLDGEWFLTGNDKPWRTEAVDVLSERLVMRPGLRVVS